MLWNHKNHDKIQVNQKFDCIFLYTEKAYISKPKTKTTLNFLELVFLVFFMSLKFKLITTA